MQKRHMRKIGPLKKVRMRLPEGFCALRENLGDIIRERRQAYEYGTGLSPQELADITVRSSFERMYFQGLNVGGEIRF